MSKKIKRLLNEGLKKVDNLKQLGTKVTAGRIVPTPSNSLKPKIFVKPKDKK